MIRVNYLLQFLLRLVLLPQVGLNPLSKITSVSHHVQLPLRCILCCFFNASTNFLIAAMRAGSVVVNTSYLDELSAPFFSLLTGSLLATSVLTGSVFVGSLLTGVLSSVLTSLLTTVPLEFNFTTLSLSLARRFTSLPSASSSSRLRLRSGGVGLSSLVLAELVTSDFHCAIRSDDNLAIDSVPSFFNLANAMPSFVSYVMLK